MKKNLFFFGLLLFSISAHSQQKETSSLLWEIKGKELSAPSYLFGTIHMICKQDYFMPDAVKQRFDSAKTIYLELDMDDPGMQMELMRLAMLPAGESLKQLFGKDYARVDSIFKAKTQVPMVLFNRFKPMMVMSMLYLKMLPCADVEAYETNFVSMAKKQKKELKGLETVKDQMQVFDNIPDSIEIKNILQLINTFDAQQKQFADMVATYKQQDVQQLFASTSNSPDLMNAEEDLLVKRNSNWIPVMEKAMKNSSCFFAVGAAHLGGDIGVIALLRKAGYTVTPVMAH